MDLRDIIFGLIWLIVGNISFYFLYPVFGAVSGYFGTAAAGTFGLSETMVNVGWGGFMGAWFLVNCMGIYYIIKGANR